MTYSAEVLADSPLGYWKLNETSGTTLADSSGNGHDATIIGTLTLGATGIVPSSADTCVAFPGTAGNYAEVPGGAWMDSDTYTVEAWVELTDTGTDVFLSRYGNSDTTDVWDFYFASGTVHENQYVGHTATSLASTSACNDGNGHQVAFTSDGTSTILYVDGVQVALGAAGTWVRSTSQAIRFGQRGSGALFYPGKLAHAAFYGTALSADRITAHYNAGVAAGGTTLPVGTTTETDTAHGVSRAKRLAVNVATETSTAQLLVRAKRSTLGVAAEADGPQPVARRSSRTLGTAIEVNSGQPFDKVKALTLGVAAEADTAHNPIAPGFTLLGVAAETDTAGALTRRKSSLLGGATETNTATSLMFRKITGLGVAVEADAALRLRNAHGEVRDIALAATPLAERWSSLALADRWTSTPLE